MGFEYKITEMVQKLHIYALSAKDIANKLGFYSKFEIMEIEKVLKSMVANGQLTLSNSGKYFAVKEQKKYRGVLRGNKRGFAFLIREDGGEDLFVPHKNLGKAMHGDTVDAVIVKGDEAKVVSVVERGITRLVGSYQKSANFGFVVPDDNGYFADIFIPRKKDMNAPNNTKVVVSIDKFGGRNPVGHIVEVIGNIGEKQSDVLSILKSYGFDNVFPKEVDREANQMTTKPTVGRTSFVDLPTISIDGDDSKDLDDAVSVLKYDNFYKLYVHIADVSHFVEKGSVLDREAFKRATSVYFPGSVYPMLPTVLSNGLCSLNEGVDRLTLTCQMTISKSGEVLDSDICKSIINNNHAMTYNNVTKILEGDQDLRAKYKDIVGMIEDARDLAEILHGARERRGSINFDTVESKIILDDKGDVVDIKPYVTTISNGMIEEFMLIANETVAKFACDHELPFVFRVHEKPDSEKMTEFRKFVEICGYKVKGNEITPKVLQNLLADIEGSAVEGIVSKVMLRSMQKAKYTNANLGHFGLAAEYYCHFTSPIRRYPDLQIHRNLKAYLDGKLDGGKLAGWCKEVADVSSEREKASEQAERDIDDYYKTEYMQKHIGEQYSGVVSGVTAFGIFVELPNTCEGMVRVENLPQDEYAFVENRYLLQGAKHKYVLGQAVDIEVVACDMENRRVSFKVVE